MQAGARSARAEGAFVRSKSGGRTEEAAKSLRRFSWSKRGPGLPALESAENWASKDSMLTTLEDAKLKTDVGLNSNAKQIELLEINSLTVIRRALLIPSYRHK